MVYHVSQKSTVKVGLIYHMLLNTGFGSEGGDNYIQKEKDICYVRLFLLNLRCGTFENYFILYEIN